MTSICTDPGSAGSSAGIFCAMTLSFESLASSLAHVPRWRELGFGDEDYATFTCPSSSGRFADDPGNQRIDTVGGLQCRQRHRGVDARALLLRRQHGVLQDAGDAPGDDVGLA